MTYLFSIVKNFAKLAVVGAAVKLSYDQGVWDANTANGCRLMSEMQKKVVPGTVFFPEQLPKPNEMRDTFESKWNQGVQTTFCAIKSFPNEVKRFMRIATASDV